MRYRRGKRPAERARNACQRDDKKWVKSASDPELGAYEDKYQCARAYCRKHALQGYPEHLDKDAQWQKDQVETVGLDLAAMKAAQDASPAASS